MFTAYLDIFQRIPNPVKSIVPFFMRKIGIEHHNRHKKTVPNKDSLYYFSKDSIL